MKEGPFTKALKEHLESMGAFVFKCHGSAMQKKGMPDMYIGHALFNGWAELKGTTTRTDPLQWEQIGRLRASGVPAGVLRIEDDGSVTAQTEELSGKVEVARETGCLTFVKLAFALAVG